MAFSLPIPIGGSGPVVDPNLPSSLTSLANKWSSLQPYTDNLDPTVVNSIFDLDRQRLLKGQSPLSTQVTARALLSASQGHPVTPAPHRNPLNVIGNTLTDVGDIARGIFKAPAQAISDIRQLPHLGEAIANGQGNELQRVLRAPVIRFIPGTQTAARLAGGEFSDIASHPLLTLLDILPGASKLAEGSAVGAEAARVAEEAGTSVRPIKAVLTQKLLSGLSDEQGNPLPPTLARNALGQAIDRLAITGPGRILQSTFGAESRIQSRQTNYGTEAIREAVTPGAPLNNPIISGAEDVAKLAQQSTTSLLREFPEATNPDTGPAWIKQQSDRYETDDYINADPRELLFASKARDIRDQLDQANLIRGYTKQGPNGELYDAKTADRLNATAVKVSHAQSMADLREAMTNGVADTGTLFDQANTVLNRPPTPGFGTGTLTGRLRTQAELAGQISKSSRAQQLSAITHALEASGVDATPIQDTIKAWRSNKTPTTLDDIRAAFDQVKANPQPLTLTPKSDILAVVNQHSNWAKAGQLKQAITQEDWGQAKSLTRQILGNKITRIPELESFSQSIDKYYQRDKALDNLSQYTPKKVARLATNAANELSNTPPPRFTPLIQRNAKAIMTERATSGIVDPVRAGEVANLILQDRFQEAGFTPKDVNDITNGVAGTWQQLQEAGANPQFEHHVSPAALSQLRHPVISETPITPTQAKVRSLDYTPYAHDIAASFSHEAMGILRRTVAENNLQSMRDRGVLETKASIISRLTPTAERLMSTDPRIASFNDALQQAIAREAVPFNPEAHGFNWSSRRLSQLADEDLYIPRYLADNFKRMFDPKPALISRAVDPIMHTFRVSVLGLSPKFQLHGAIGGFIAGLLRTGPEFVTALPHAYSLAMAAEKGEMATLADIHPEVRLAFSAGKTVYDEANYAAGRSLSRVMQEYQPSPLIQKGGDILASPAVQGPKGLIDTASNKSFTFAQRIHAMYRISGFLYGENKALAAGLGAEDAARAGMELSRSLLPEWAAQTPIERTIFRSVMPFYPFASFLTKYALSYPMDHPFRAMVLSNIAQAELADMHNGLPPSMSAMMFFGSPDSKGRVLGFDPGSLNPFKNTGNIFTVAGFLAGMNPIFETLLGQAGLKFGRADPYPNLHYNPQTGKMEVTTPGLLQSFAQNVIPQISVLSYVTGQNKQLADLMKTDPEAARRQLYQAVGLPTPVRRISIPGEIAKRELTLEPAASAAFSSALKGGGAMDAYANRFPSVKPILDNIRALSSTQLAPYIPTAAAINQSAPTRTLGTPVGNITINPPKTYPALTV